MPSRARQQGQPIPGCPVFALKRIRINAPVEFRNRADDENSAVGTLHGWLESALCPCRWHTRKMHSLMYLNTGSRARHYCPSALIEEAVYPYLGEQKTLDDVERARDALERAYHAAGYLTVLVTIPQQKVEEAVVRLAVTEAPVARLRVMESRYFSPADIKDTVPELAEGNVPNFTEMQKQLANLNRSADRRVTPVLRAGKTPGTVEVDLKVKDQLPLHGSVELNSRQIPNTTLTRLSANVSWDNLWHRQHSLGVTGLVAPQNPDESKVISANYTLPVPTGGFLALYSVYSDSNVASVGTLNVLGNGVIVGGRYILPLPGSEKFFHTATLGMDYKDFGQNIQSPRRRQIQYAHYVYAIYRGVGWHLGRRSKHHQTGTIGQFSPARRGGK